LSHSLTLYTIGFTQKSAEEFFGLLGSAGVRRVIDVRLKNVSQLTGFTKKGDLEYFLRAIGNIEYEHRPDLAPSPEIFDYIKKQKGTWRVYETRFLRLLAEREIEKHLAPDMLDRACLLCTEPTADHCHRRLVAEYLQEKWGGMEIVHL
jgi:uncharacterized protein (DUF488 family)